MNKFKYHIFIAHSGADHDIALQLYQTLIPTYQVFLDSESLLPGDAWDDELMKAQGESLITAVLISPNTEAAYYQREEIATAVDLSRQQNYSHRVVPIYLHYPDIPVNVPYGLRRLHGIYMSKDVSISEVVQKLQRLLVAIEQIKEEVEIQDKEQLPSENIPKLKSRDQDDEVVETIDTIRSACKAKRIPASLIYMDVDGLSLINKVFGRKVGNEVIQIIEGLLMDIFREYLSVRRGEDEFLCCIKGKGEAEAIALGERLREMVEIYPWTSIAPDLHVTISMGVIELGRKEETTDGIIRAFYGANIAKKLGGNKVKSGPLVLPKYISRDLDDYGS